MDAFAAVAELAADNRSGATALAERAAALLARAGHLEPDALAAACIAIAKAQPAMAPILRLANAALLAATAAPDEPGAVRDAVERFVADLRAHAEQAAHRGADLIPEGRVLTHSASSLVAEAILAASRTGRRIEVICTESRPALEGQSLAARLASQGVPVTLIVDAAAPALLARCDLLLLGADTVCAAGLVHKVGTLGLAAAARYQGVPAYALATEEKLLPRVCGDRPPIPERDPAEVLPDPPPGMTPLNFYYDLTPRFTLAGIVTERGLLLAEELERRLDEIPVHPAFAGLWGGLGLAGDAWS